MTLDSAELTEWMAYYRIEPFGENRADLRAGIIASTMANLQRGKNGQTYKPEDFMPYREAQKQDARSLFNQIKAGIGNGK